MFIENSSLSVEMLKSKDLLNFPVIDLAILLTFFVNTEGLASTDSFCTLTGEIPRTEQASLTVSTRMVSGS